MVSNNSTFVKEVYQLFCNHFVGLAIWYDFLNPDGTRCGETQFSIYSGTIISIKGMWNYLTAGHIISDIENKSSKNRISIRETKFIDYFGSDVVSHEPIPFDYKSSPRFFIDKHEDGLDFGLLLINSNTRGLMEKNGIVAISDSEWKNQPESFFDKYWLIGFPKERSVSEKVNLNNSSYTIRGHIQPVVLCVNKVSGTELVGGKTQFPQFIGKLEDHTVLVNHIDGMSGGPIIGISKDLSQEWIIAIQSNWLKGSRIIFGCQVPILASLVEEWLDQSKPDDLLN